jgi:hypothetical protein
VRPPDQMITSYVFFLYGFRWSMSGMDPVRITGLGRFPFLPEAAAFGVSLVRLGFM